MKKLWELYPHARCKQGVIHVGAHRCEEQPHYDAWGVGEHVLWIDGNDELCAANQAIVNAVVSDVDDGEVDFILTDNDAMSSSILELKEHKIEHPTCLEAGRIKKKTITLDTLLARRGEKAVAYDLLAMDVQGAELMVLKGAAGVLENVRCIITEVNTKELYAGCVRVEELDAFLGERGFVRVETQMTRHGWGDAVYMRRAVSVCVNSGLGNRLFQLAFLWAIAKATRSIPVLIEKHIEVCGVHTTDKNKYAVFYDLFERVADFPVRARVVEDPRRPCVYVDYTERVRKSNAVVTLFSGYFQSEKYFAECSEEVHAMFRRALGPEGITAKNFIHVRGRDHIATSNTPHRLPNMPGYYERTLTKSGLARDDETVVITDDIDYVRDVIGGALEGFPVLGREVDELDALRCMAGCRGGVAIVGNSTFSWWGAYLAQVTTVYMPYPYLLDGYGFEDIYYDGVRKVNVYGTAEVFDSVVSCRRVANWVTVVLVRKGERGPWITDRGEEDVRVNGRVANRVSFYDAEIYAGEPYNDICVIEAELNNDGCREIELMLNGYVRNMPMVQQDTEAVDLVAMTLFKDDVDLVPGYVEHYKALGVERFWLYYNGTLALEALPVLEGVTYIAWPYAYMVDKKHYAQLGAMTDMLYMARHAGVKYVLYNDLDEFIIWRPKHMSLKDFVLGGGFDVYGVLNNFVFVEDGEAALREQLLAGAYTKSFQMEFGHRSKCIVRPEAISTLMGVHMPMTMDEKTTERICVMGGPMCEMLHVCNVPGRIHVSFKEDGKRRLLALKDMIRQT